MTTQDAEEHHDDAATPVPLSPPHAAHGCPAHAGGRCRTLPPTLPARSHFPTWHYQPERRAEGHSWRSTIRTQRLQLRLLLRDSPSLRPQVPPLVVDIYLAARAEACDETGLPETTFPQECPWTVEQMLDDDFWPAGITQA
jgi:hypothetical protein